ncbi:MAG: hypothetical protein ACREMN_11255 [Gemmatimonadales bacterium]
MKFCVLLAAGVVVSSAPAHHAIRAPIASALQPSAYVYLGDYPQDRENGWSDKLQGVAHDDRHWFFTQKARLWRFPDSLDLHSHVNRADPGRGILRVGIPRDLAAKGYDHFGDLDQHRGLLVVPLEGAQPPVIAVFRAHDLGFVGQIALPRQRNAGWTAVDPATGRVYSSESEVGPREASVLAYAPPWDEVLAGRLPRELLPVGQLQPRDASGALLRLAHLQGGVVADGELVTVNGPLQREHDQHGDHDLRSRERRASGVVIQRVGRLQFRVSSGAVVSGRGTGGDRLLGSGRRARSRYRRPTPRHPAR